MSQQSLITDPSGSLRYGGDYNPEQWDRATWSDDIELMKRAGVNLVTLGVFNWSSIEPEEGRYTFEWVDEILDLLHQAGVKVDFATPTASPPPWFVLKYPESVYEDNRGLRTHYGSRNHYCPSSADYRRACIELATELGRRYGNHPAVVMWHIGNEYGPQCFCDSCAVSFREWLAERHGSIENLNANWGTAFWSQGYSSFDEVIPPRNAPYHLNTAHLLDHKRHTSYMLLRLYREQRDALRPLVNGNPITTNFMGIFSGVDGWQWADEVDLIADDHYHEHAKGEYALAYSSMIHDVMRSLQNRPWLMMEQAMGAVNWRDHNVPKTSSQRRNDVLRAIGRGADGVLTFQFRASRSGVERFHSALVPHAGPDSSYFRSVEAIGADLGRLQPIIGQHQPSQVAILLDWDSLWLYQDPALPTHRDFHGVLQAWHQILWAQQIPVDFRHPEDDLSGYAVVLAPTTHAASDAAIANLRGYLDGGGSLVIGPFSFVSDSQAAIRPAPFPAGLADLLGARVEQWWPLPEGGLALTGLFDTTADGYAEQVTVDDAEVLLRAVDHPELGAVVVRSPRLDLTAITADLPSDALARVLGQVFERRQVVPQLGPLVEAGGCEVIQRGTVTLVLNNTAEPADLALTSPVTDLLTGQSHTGAILVPAGGAAALTTP